MPFWISLGIAFVIGVVFGAFIIVLLMGGDDD